VCMVICVVKDKIRYKIKIRWFFHGWVSRRYTTRDAIHNSAMLAPHTQRHKKARCTAMTIRPYKPRDSARSALLTAVRSRR